ncbi:MAG: permease [Cyanophyceae cyanobacterium]
MTQLTQALTLFFSLFVTALPFLLFGIVVSSFLLVFIKKQWLSDRFPKNPLFCAVMGSCLGVVIPVGQYGNVPVARRLILQGVPLPVAISFLVAAPIVNPMTIWLSWQALQAPGTYIPESHLVFQVAFALLTAIVLGLIFGAYKNRRQNSVLKSSLLLSGTFLVPSHRNSLTELSSSRQKQPQTDIPLRLLNNIRQELLQLAPALAVGSALAAIVNLFVPHRLFLGHNSPTQILASMSMGMILSTGSTAIPFAIGSLPVTNGALLSFGLAGAVVDLKSVSLLLLVFRFKPLLYLIILFILLTFLLTLSLDFYL